MILAAILYAVLIVFVIFTAAGCTSFATRGSRMLPWNWFSSDSTAKIEKAQVREQTADTQLREAAHRNAIATTEAIAIEKARQLAEGGISRELETAADYAQRTVQSLNASEGFLGFDVQREISEMVRLRNSQVAAERERGDKLLAAADKIAGRAATAKVAASKALTLAQKKVGEEQQRALVAEEKYHRIWFWIWFAVGGYVLMQILPLLAQAFPAVGPIAKAASWIAAPAVQAGYSRLRGAVGNVINTAEKASSISIEVLRERLDGPISPNEQDELFRHYLTAKAKTS